MKIGIDLDDVLSKTTEGFIEFHNKNYGTNLDVKTKEKYGWWEIIDQPRDVYEKRLIKFNATQYFKNTQPVKGAREILERLKKNNELFVITARGDDVKGDTEKWVKNNFPNIFSEIYFTNQFGQTGTKISKRMVCDNLDIDVYIDDSLEFALECARQNRKVYLLNYPWNQTDKLPEGVTRVYSWGEIGKFIS
jgi:uncharacterized HAD superfamily protein